MDAATHRSVPIVGCLALVVLTFIFHHQALRSWWLSDDPQVLVHARTTTPLGVLFSPHAYRYLSSSSFTPLVTISFALDYALAGMSPLFFYAHQLLALSVAASLLFLLLARAGQPLPAWLGSAVFLLAPPTVLVARGLMLRHYLEGLIFALLALLLWDVACRGKSPRRASALVLGAATLYLAAMLAKEFYTPLPLLMLAIAYARRSPWRSTVNRIAPSALAALLYLLWRWSMLGSGGGYGDSVSLPAIAVLPLKIFHAVRGALPIVPAALIAAASLVIAIVAVWRIGRAAIVFISTGFVFVFLPLVALATSFEQRYAFVGFTFFVAALTLAIQWMRARFVSTAFLFVVASFAAFIGWKEHQKLEFNSRAIIAEGQYVWTSSKNVLPLLASSPGWYLAGLNELRRLDGRGDGPSFVLSIDAVVLGVASDVMHSLWGTSQIVPVGNKLTADVTRLRALKDSTLPLSFRLEKRQNELSWNVTPVGSWFEFVSVPYYGKFSLPAQGRRRLPEARERQFFRVRREAEGGRWTVSPVMEMPRGDGVVTWSSGKAEN